MGLGLQCLGACLLGWSLGTAQNYRFGAMRLAPSQPATAASLVLFGGVLGSLLGPGGLTQVWAERSGEFSGFRGGNDENSGVLGGFWWVFC